MELEHHIKHFMPTVFLAFIFNQRLQELCKSCYKFSEMLHNVTLPGSSLRYKPLFMWGPQTQIFSNN